jgi:imidazolonepropionase-like amidohydrolase
MTIHPATRRTVLFLSLLLLIGLAACGDRSEEAHFALVGGTLIDGTGGPPLINATVVVRGRYIEAVGPSAEVVLEDGITRVDASGKWILPGLIDAHAHIQRWMLPRYLAAGVTTVRGLHGEQDSILGLAEQANLNAFPSPQLFVAGAMIDGVPPTRPDASGVRDETEGRQAVDQRSIAGVDQIMTYTRLPPAILGAIVDEARSFNLPVAAQLGLTDALTAARQGVRSIEQLSGVVEATTGNASELYAAHRQGYWQGWTAAEQGWVRLRPLALKDVAERLAETGVILVPMLAAHDTYSRLDDPSVVESASYLSTPDSIRTRWDPAALTAAAGWSLDFFRTARLARESQNRFLRDFAAAGGSIAVGSNAGEDFFAAGDGFHTEIELLAAAGLSPMETIVAATGNGARLVGADSIGTLAPGKVANLVILARDPLSDIRNTRSVERVILRGAIMSADSIRASW